MPLIPGGTLREFLEVLLGKPERLEPRRGAPFLRLQKPEEVRYAVWLADVRGQNANELAYWLRFGTFTTVPKRIGQPVSRKVARYIESGRRLLHDDGVLPWLLWQNGQLSTDWSAARGFGIALAYWYRFYVAWNAREIALARQFAEVNQAKKKLLHDDPVAALREALEGRPP